MTKRQNRIGTSIRDDARPSGRLMVDQPWDALVVQFSEIALKGGNRRLFTKKLAWNIKKALADGPETIERTHDRLMIKTTPERAGDVARRVAQVFGVSHVAPVRYLPLDFQRMKEEAILIYKSTGPDGRSFVIRIKRANKQFPLTSTQMEQQIGAAVVEATGAPVDLHNPDLVISFQVKQDGVFLVGPPEFGPDGLPIGVSGRVLTLFSGGIDSPPAAWMMMKRGCLTDFIHFYAQPGPEAVMDSKITELIETLLRPHGMSARLFAIPYESFEMALLTSQVPQELELILFRRFMARVSAAVARQKECSAIVTGDNLSQVASQTMANLVAFDDAVDLPVFRPLLAHNKQDIVDLARRIGTFEASVRPYKDCCSLVARHPDTNPKLRIVRDVESGLPIEEMTATAIASMSTYIIRGSSAGKEQNP
ncbi:MAG: tRNA 4-thiouridine(8) synthase ThiI [Spartobacteria bacterium]|nr:tRNA 4-thiouridine(8) synthase ThiI [Spartobacteria bacterium]